MKFGLGNKVLNDSYLNEKKGLVPSTEWKKNTLGKGWVLGESLITGIGQGYIQTTPLQLCLMTAQLANGGHKIYPRIVVDKNQISAEDIKNQMIIADNENKAQSLLSAGADFFKLDNKKYFTLYENKKNIKDVLESMFSSTNEVSGTSYRSRIDNPKYQFAGKTGTSQVKKITAKDRELELKTNQIPYEERDHALYVAFGPYKNPQICR